MSSNRPIQNQVIVAGVGYSEIARDTGRSEGSLTLEASLNAIADAGMTVDDIDGITTFPDRVSSAFEGPPITYMQRALGMTSIRYWQAMGWGPAQLTALVGAIYAIVGGGADTVLCYRGHKRQEHRFYTPTASNLRLASGENAYRAPYGFWGGTPQLALWAKRYMHEFGLTEAQLGSVVVTCREHAQLNPRAVWCGHPLSIEEYFEQPMISSPFRIVDCDMPVDGAVAIVLTRADRAGSLPHKPVYVNSIGHATGPNCEWNQWPDFTTTATKFAADQLWEGTDLRPRDVDVAQLYDGFSWFVLCWLEDLGFCPKGEGGAWVAEGRGRLGAELPICTDGGQLGGGRVHGFSKVAEAVLQIRGDCGARQVHGAEVAVACTGGGPIATTMLLTA
jgi:acetyl-CoA acetyltransferase